MPPSGFAIRPSSHERPFSSGSGSQRAWNRLHGARRGANLGASPKRFRCATATLITRQVAVGLACFVCAAGCRDKSDEFAKATRCLREHDAQDVTLTSFSRAAAGRGWRLQRLDVGGDKIILLGARTDRRARDAQKRVEGASEALGGPLAGSIVVGRRGSLVYWWERAPAPGHRELFDACL